MDSVMVDRIHMWAVNAGIEIIAKYSDDKNYDLDSEIGKLIISPTTRPMSSADIEKMKLLGWFQTKRMVNNRPRNCWTAFVFPDK